MHVTESLGFFADTITASLPVSIVYPNTLHFSVFTKISTDYIAFIVPYISQQVPTSLKKARLPDKLHTHLHSPGHFLFVPLLTIWHGTFFSVYKC